MVGFPNTLTAQMCSKGDLSQFPSLSAFVCVSRLGRVFESGILSIITFFTIPDSPSSGECVAVLDGRVSSHVDCPDVFKKVTCLCFLLSLSLCVYGAWVECLSQVCFPS